MRQKINKYIEIVTVLENASLQTEQQNVGITLDIPVIFDVLSQRYEKVSVSVIKTADDLKVLTLKKPDLVFSGIKYFCFDAQDGVADEDAWLSNFLDAHRIAYIGSTVRAYRNSYDKTLAKQIIQDAGIKTAHSFTTQPDEHALIQSLPISFPLFVKPASGGDSKGIDANSIVSDFKGFQAKVLDIYQNHQRRSLVETYLSGKEYTVGVFENAGDGKLTAMPVEIIPGKNKNGDRILDYAAKKDDSEQVLAVTDPRIHTLLSNLATNAFKALEATSHARIDIKMDEDGVPHFLEGNLKPGLGKGYLYRACALNQKMSYEQMIYNITDNALSRHSAEAINEELFAVAV